MNLTREGVRTPFQIYPGIFVPPGTYDHQEAQLVWMTNQGAPLSLNLQTFFGGFFAGDRADGQPTFASGPVKRSTWRLAYQRNDVTSRRAIQHQPGADARVLLLHHAHVPQSLVQYNDRADIWSMNLRFGWLQAANTGLFIVYNDSRGLYDLFPIGAERTDRSLTVKFSRMFDVLQ